MIFFTVSFSRFAPSRLEPLNAEKNGKKTGILDFDTWKREKPEKAEKTEKPEFWIWTLENRKHGKDGKSGCAKNPREREEN